MSIFTIFRTLLFSVIAMSLLAGWSVYRMNAAEREHYRAQQTQIELMSLGQALADGSDYLTSEVRRYVQFGDTVHFDNFWNEVKKTRSRDRAVERLKELGVQQKNLTFIEKAKRYSDQLINTERQAMEAVANRDFDTARKLVFSKYYDEQKRLIMGNIKLFQQMTNRQAQEISQKFHDRMSFYMLLGNVLLALSAALVFYLVYGIGIRRLINPLKTLTAKMRTLADGNLDIPIVEKPSPDEMGDMEKALEVFRQNVMLRKKVEIELKEEKAFKELIRVVAIAANEMSTLNAAARVCLSAVCKTTGWPVGHFLILDEESGRLVSSGIWQVEEPERYREFMTLSETMSFAPGEGLPGRVAKSGQPAWIEDLSEDGNLSRVSIMAKFGLRSGMASPVMVGDKVYAVAEFFMPCITTLHVELMKAMGAVGIEMGRVIEREKADRTLQAHMANLEFLVRERTRELERSNQELTDFASIASHDLSEPLRKVTLLGDCLRERLDPDDLKSRDFLRRMQNATRRMQGLIDNLLSYSMVATRPHPFEEVKIDVTVRQSLLNLDGRLKETGGRVIFESLPVIEAYPVHIRQLFQNLIGNGLKYHRKEVPPVIRIFSRPCVDGMVQLMIEDNGIGMDQKYADRVFRPFQRLHNGNEYEGTGMGLAICKKIVERHNGTIQIESEQGKGSTFIVCLPEKQLASSAQE